MLNKKNKNDKNIYTEMTKTTISIPSVWHKEIKIRCVKEGKKMSEEIQRAIQEYFKL